MTGSLSLERGLSVLETLKAASEPVGVREIARGLELSAPAVQRLLNTLDAYGYVEQCPKTRRYRLGQAVLVLAQHMLRKDRLIELAEPELRVLAAQGCFNAFLGTRHGSAGIYLMGIQSQSPVVIRSSPGERLALHSTALGKALLLGLAYDAIAKIFRDAPLERLTPRTVTDLARLMDQLQMARTIGYTTSLDENILGVISVGAPVRNASGAVIAAISVAYPRSVGPQVEVADVAECVMAAAGRISSGLGFSGQDDPQAKDPRHAA